ncbi:ATP-binding cassette domain-containing protein [Undibacterium sp. TJN19]|uniref:ATP-binding cassette domain-containing protein n=1 Tax=Undibacterium sp. TJN19 TaxID=3413055 RepID=UPI003BF1A5AE
MNATPYLSLAASLPPLPYSVGARLLSIEQVCVSHDGPVLSNVSAHIDNLIRDGVHQGQVVCLLGPSGIGKTQLFRCIAGLQKPDSGGVFLNGKKTPVTPGEVGVVAQNYPLLAHRTVLGNLMVAASHKTRNKAQAQARAISLLEDFDLADKAFCYPAALSGGQRQRIAIAQQTLCSEHFLLMDEPFSGLDPLAKSKVCDTILKISTQDELNTIIVVSHDIDACITIADTIWLLGRDHDKDGKAIAGAHIKYRYDLIERGLAWHTNMENTPEFMTLSMELKRRFREL